MKRLTEAQRSPAPAWRRLDSGTFADVELWCAECQHYVTYSGKVDDQRAVHVTPAMLAAHRAEHAAVAA